MTVIATEGEAESLGERVFRAAWKGVIVLLVGLLIFLAWLVRVGELYEPGSDFGYNLGLMGGLLMLTLLLYPLRKRSALWSRLGKMESWFKFHMLAGVVGPLLILFHSTFKTGSMNGAMALYAMILVALSGVVGRFIYRHIHRGLYGRHLTLADVAEDLATCAGNMGSVFALQPDIEPRLKSFQAEAFAEKGFGLAHAWRFAILRWQGQRLAKNVRRDAKQALLRRWKTEGGPRREMVLNYRLARDHINQYIESVIKASQLTAWERMFSYWHLVHVPFLYLLIFSGVVHVVAVHMY